MIGIFDPAYYWLPLGASAFIFAAVNLIRSLLRKKAGWTVLLFLSLSCGALSLLAEYQLVNRWVQKSDWSALLDVVPGMSRVLMVFVAIGILLNAVVLILNSKE